MSSIFPLIIEHLLIVLAATAISVVIGVGLGIVAYWVRYVDKLILWLAEVIQTIPSLALLALLMILFGLGNVTIIAGLVLYALMPIIRNTYTGLETVSPPIKDAARGMGMNKLQRLVKVELPLSFPLIFSGIRIAVVNSLSIAVMGVLIGAGGLGYPIYRGIQTHSMERILMGAVPVVLMALVFDYFMTKIERRMVKRAASA
ncbi:ABC transporter permease [Sinanaerobacter chloroacetimidivorans]|jgi:osmoprotectant transport system permease protein|uniref:ABC transporter permease n=1 Tax=Sinanaerobacter chloroacetimidivorans TaxID=2818044 RepID=A0A8J8B1Q9_9FIRM|nr:ABC transporter permease [Sinanaerobacter chloroacetimidivorans]MBR0597997.1 ABC transporter permease [Sinanaerobacter chloroacetimidivorans]